VDVYSASGDVKLLDAWTEELAGKIVVLADVTTGSQDIAPVPTDTNFPPVGVHAHIMHTLLTEGFIHPFSWWEMLLVEGLLLGLVLYPTLRYSPLKFALCTGIIALGYILAVGTIPDKQLGPQPHPTADDAHP
jgi:CHASE2 domain-containing sensor protein